MRSRLVLPAVFAASAIFGGILVMMQRPADPLQEPAGPQAAQPPAVPVSQSPSDEAPPPTAPADDHAQEVIYAAECSDRMMLVDGYYCPFVAHRCRTERKAEAQRLRVCEEFFPEVMCEGTLERLRFCIDAYEYPNHPSALPAILVDYDQATNACEAEGKRLCSVREWTLACEGESVLPLPNGLSRAPGECPVDRGAEPQLGLTRGAAVAEAVASADRRALSGAATACRSPFGAFEMVGNVAEWVTDPHGGRNRAPFVSVVVGGSWGPEAAHCRLQEDAVAPAHRAAQLGFRCCSDPSARGPEKPARKRASSKGFVPIADTR